MRAVLFVGYGLCIVGVVFKTIHFGFSAEPFSSANGHIKWIRLCACLSWLRLLVLRTQAVTATHTGIILSTIQAFPVHLSPAQRTGLVQQCRH